MAVVGRSIYQFYKYLMYDVADPRTNNWPLIGSPFPGIAILVFYLYFVQKLGPALMKHRKPFNLDKIIQFYNIFQIVCCGILFYKGLVVTYLTSGYSLACTRVDTASEGTPVKLALYFYCYFLLKITDLIETFFFVLRKKDRQISFLHLYHHTGMVLLSWGGVKYFPGGHGAFIGIINTFIHMLMYVYYFVTSYNPAYKNRIWWKKYITQLQMIQFLCIMCHNLALLFTKPCGYPRWTVGILLPGNTYMFYLFADFYRKAYLQPILEEKKSS